MTNLGAAFVNVSLKIWVRLEAGEAGGTLAPVGCPSGTVPSPGNGLRVGVPVHTLARVRTVPHQAAELGVPTTWGE